MSHDPNAGRCCCGACEDAREVDQLRTRLAEVGRERDEAQELLAEDARVAMTKPHEETWEVIGTKAKDGEFGPWWVVHRGNLLAAFGDGCANPDRARLTAAAPEMARLLLEMEYISDGGDFGPCCHSCGVSPSYPEKRHAPELHRPDCAWVAVLRKAGVLP